MTEFKDIIFKPNIVVHCPEEWMAKDFLKYVESCGYIWDDDENIIPFSWELYKEDTCYHLYGNSVATITFYQMKGRIVMSYYDVIIKEEK